MQQTDSAFAIDEKIIDRIKDIFSEFTEISAARKKMADDPEIKPLYDSYRFKVEEKNKHGKCQVTLSHKDGTKGDLPIQVHLHSMERDRKYPSREIYNDIG